MSIELSPGWIGLMRHAQAWYPGMSTEERSTARPDLTKSGAAATQGISQRVADMLKEFDCAPNSVTLYHVDTPQTRQTVKILGAGLRPLVKTIDLRIGLSPNQLKTYTVDKGAVGTAWTDVSETLEKPCVIVGHDPQITWLLHAIARRKVRQLSLATGELMILEPAKKRWRQARRYRRPRFVFSPSDSETAKALRAKIESKMKIAGVLGGFLTGLFTYAAQNIIGRANAPAVAERLAAAGLALLGTAIILYFITLLCYDRLLMPTRFWVSKKPPKAKRRINQVLRPPGSDVWMLYEGMLRVWNRAFVPATALAGLGVAALAVARVGSTHWWHYRDTALVIMAVCAVSVWTYWWARVRLGVND